MTDDALTGDLHKALFCFGFLLLPLLLLLLLLHYVMFPNTQVIFFLLTIRAPSGAAATIHNTRDEGLANLLASRQKLAAHFGSLSWHHYTGTNFAMIARAVHSHLDARGLRLCKKVKKTQTLNNG